MRDEGSELFELVDNLDVVCGGSGYNPADNGLGRAGPGLRWQGLLGNHYTPEALRHDLDVRAGLQAGMSPLRAHASALPSLPAAIGSWFRARFRPGAQDVNLG